MCGARVVRRPPPCPAGRRFGRGAATREHPVAIRKGHGPSTPSPCSLRRSSCAGRSRTWRSRLSCPVRCGASRHVGVQRLDEYILPRRVRWMRPSWPSSVGPTGPGHSTLMNSLVGSEVSLSGAVADDDVQPGPASTPMPAAGSRTTASARSGCPPPGSSKQRRRDAPVYSPRSGFERLQSATHELVLDGEFYRQQQRTALNQTRPRPRPHSHDGADAGTREPVPSVWRTPARPPSAIETDSSPYLCSRSNSRSACSAWPCERTSVTMSLRMKSRVRHAQSARARAPDLHRGVTRKPRGIST